MPLPEPVTQLGELVAEPGRGLVCGNRGCLHDDRERIRRRYAGTRWIACRLRFRGWHRERLLQPDWFTELFFLDEATAFAAGHRPCALCAATGPGGFPQRLIGREVIDGLPADASELAICYSGFASVPIGVRAPR
jgi:hypothetical protein